jgi:uncharacterized protein YbcV (DUF1398 family)
LAQLADDNDREFFGHLNAQQKTDLLSLLRDIVRQHEWKDLPVNYPSFINQHEEEAMNSEQTTAMEMCARGALSGELSFPDIIGRLAAIGVERYHADYSRQEITYYLPNGNSMVVAVPHPAHATADAFFSSAIEDAVRQSQRNEHTYLDFIRKTAAAGCVGYFVQISGGRVIYFGRNGQSHVELLPTASGTS